MKKLVAFIFILFVAQNTWAGGLFWGNTDWSTDGHIIGLEMVIRSGELASSLRSALARKDLKKIQEILKSANSQLNKGLKKRDIFTDSNQNKITEITEKKCKDINSYGGLIPRKEHRCRECVQWAKLHYQFTKERDKLLKKGDTPSVQLSKETEENIKEAQQFVK